MSDRPTLPPSATEQEQAAFAEQAALTAAMIKHAEPHVRLIAHMSERQLVLSERVSEISSTLKDLVELVRGARNDMSGLSEGVSSLSEAHADLLGRVEEIEALVHP